MSTQTPPAAEKKSTVTIKVDGRPVEARPDRPLLYALLEAGTPVPHYCYHPGLAIAGNCRMCLVKVKGMPRLQISCNTFPKEGMEVISEDDDEVARNREIMMEFLLINHPLDCPVCDQAGECWLQDFAYEHGRDVGRFREDKVHKHTKRMGEGSDVRLWGERCIQCSRCVRFLEEVSGTGELTLVNRGDHTTIDVHPDVALTNPLAGNVVDICPVGALVSDDFLYSARAWHLSIVDSVCPGCAKGCNITVESHRGEIRRLRPRVNLDVNEYWMCDHGRFDFKYVRSPKRLERVQARDGERRLFPTLEEACSRTVVGLTEVGREFGAASLAMIADLFMTNEELFVFRELARKLGVTRIGVVGGPVKTEEVFPRFRIPADKNPNREGARRILGGEAVDSGYAKILEGLKSGAVKGLYAHVGVPRFEPAEDLAAALAGLEFLVFHGIETGRLEELSHLAIPGATPFEKGGTFTNDAGRTQRIRVGLAPPDGVEPDLWVLQRLAGLAGDARERVEPLSDRAITKRLAAEVDGFRDLVVADLDKMPRRPNYLMNPSPHGLRAGDPATARERERR